MSPCPRVLIATPGTVPAQCPWWGGSTSHSLRDAHPVALTSAGVLGLCPQGPSQRVGSRTTWVEGRKDRALSASEMLLSVRGYRARRKQPGSRHDALA